MEGLSELFELLQFVALGLLQSVMPNIVGSGVAAKSYEALDSTAACSSDGTVGSACALTRV
jgi:hypothetical protein